MNPTPRFITTVMKLAAVFRIATDDVLIEAYWEVLGPWPIEAIEAGAREIIRESMFFPRPVEWRTAAEEWLRERSRDARTSRGALAQSNEPPLTERDVKNLMDGLAKKMHWFTDEEKS